MSKKIKLSSITPDDKNNNKHTAYGMDLLEKSVNKVGIIESITVSNDDKIISGNARHEVIGKNFEKEALVIETDGTQPIVIKRTDIESNTKEFYEASILANTTSKKNIDFDMEVIDSLAVEYDIDVVDLGVDIVNEEILEAEEDDFNGTPPKEPITVLGDLYEIGEHRLLCGDSTCSDTVGKLMNGEKADISFTSPPYNAAKNSHLNGRVKGFDEKYQNKDDSKSDEDYLKFLYDFTINTTINSDYSFVNIQLLAQNKFVLVEYQYQLKSLLKDILIWNKSQCPPNIVKGAFNTKWEYVFCFSEKNDTRGFPCSWQGKYSNVIETENASGNEFADIHKATFPISFPSWIIEKMDFAKSVLDLFGGTGTTMVASEQLKRKSFLMELDPKYCDVIVARMIRLDSTLPIKRNGVLLTNSEVLKFTENTSESN